MYERFHRQKYRTTLQVFNRKDIYFRIDHFHIWKATCGFIQKSKIIVVDMRNRKPFDFHIRPFL